MAFCGSAIARESLAPTVAAHALAIYRISLASRACSRQVTALIQLHSRESSWRNAASEFVS